MIAYPVYLFYFLELIAVSYFDFKTKKIKNSWSLLNLIFALLSYIFLSELFPLSIENFKYPAIFFGVGFVLYWVRVMGAGDVKFISSFFLMIPPGLHYDFLSGLIYSTIAVGSTLLLINTVKHLKFVISCIATKNIRGLKILLGKRFSYGPVVLIAWLYLGYHQFFQ